MRGFKGTFYSILLGLSLMFTLFYPYTIFADSAQVHKQDTTSKSVDPFKKNNEGIYAVARTTTDNNDDINLKLKPATKEPTEDPLSIKIEADSVSELRWLQGDKKTEDFTDGQGETINPEEKTFDVRENDLYTVYAKNAKGTETVKQIHIDNIVITYPVRLELSQSPTDPTYEPVMIDVDVSSEVGVESLRWLPGEMNAENFAEDAGHAIDLETGAFTVVENGTYTVYAVSEEGLEVTRVIEITNIQPKEDEVTTAPVTVDGNVTIPDEDIGKLAHNGTLTIDLGDAVSIDVKLSADQVQTLKGKRTALIVRNNDMEMEVPHANLLAEKDISLGVHVSDNAEGAVSAIYDLTILADGAEVSKFTAPINLTFQVDMDNVDGKDNVGAYYYDEGKKKWFAIKGAELDHGKMYFAANQFSEFGAFEMAEKEDDDVKEGDACDCDEVDEGDKNDDTVINGVIRNNGTSGNSDETGPKHLNHHKKDSSNKLPSGTQYSKQPTNYAGGSKVDGTAGTDKGSKLPSTATPMYNFMLIGAILLTAGIFSFFIYRRKRQKGNDLTR